MEVAIIRISTSRAPQGACGLKFRYGVYYAKDTFSRAPQGACGLKLKDMSYIVHILEVGLRKEPVD